MEMYLLPLLAIFGLMAVVGLGDDSEDSDTDPATGDDNNMSFGPQDDVSSGTDANDSMYLGVGDDFATGGAGDDRIFLGEGQDRTVDLDADGHFETTGMEGNDFIRGGNGRDILVDALGSNTIYGDLGYDRMNSVDADGDEGTADTMFGGFGKDVLFADNGDVLSGGAGEDRFHITVTAGMSPVTVTDFEAGDEFFLRDEDGGFQVVERITTSVSGSGTDLNVLLDDEVVAVLQGITTLPADALGNPTAPDMFGERELAPNGSVTNDDFDDVIVINDHTHGVDAFAGDDTISFAPGADTAGRDLTINAGEGDDTVTAGLGDDVINGSLGNDVLNGGGGVDEINGGFGNDTINSQDAGVLGQADTVSGGAGDDLLIGDDGDLLNGGDGVDTFEVDLNDPAAAAVSIGDFDANTETLSIEVALGAGMIPAVTYTTATDGSGTVLGAEVRVDGEVIALLTNVDPNDLNATNIIVTN